MNNRPLRNQHVYDGEAGVPSSGHGGQFAHHRKQETTQKGLFRGDPMGRLYLPVKLRHELTSDDVLRMVENGELFDYIDHLSRDVREREEHNDLTGDTGFSESQEIRELFSHILYRYEHAFIVGDEQETQETTNTINKAIRRVNTFASEFATVTQQRNPTGLQLQSRTDVVNHFGQGKGVEGRVVTVVMSDNVHGKPHAVDGILTKNSDGTWQVHPSTDRPDMSSYPVTVYDRALNNYTHPDLMGLTYW